MTLRKHPLPTVGAMFGDWTVVKVVGYRGRRRDLMISCKCICGTEKEVIYSNLYLKNSRNCGCVRREKTTQRNHRHGQSKSRLYKTWRGMKARCFNANEKCYPDYGGRGITVCEAWKNDFDAFRKWTEANGYTDQSEIDRIDNDGNYEPANCRWVSRTKNARNTRATRMITAFGETKPLAEWLEDSRCAVGYPTLHSRIFDKGFAPEEAITRPPVIGRPRQKQ